MAKALLTKVGTLGGHDEERVWYVSWSPDGELLATSGSDRTVRIWQDEEQVSKLEDAHERTIRCVEWSKCGRMLACASFDATVTISVEIMFTFRYSAT